MRIPERGSPGYVSWLEERVDDLEHRVRELTALLAEPEMPPVPEEWDLTYTEALLYLALKSGGVVSRAQITKALYPDRRAPPGYTMISVLIYKIRRKLRPFGLWIENYRGRGYRLVRLTEVEE